jgi:hypothetical protein
MKDTREEDRDFEALRLATDFDGEDCLTAVDEGAPLEAVCAPFCMMCSCESCGEVTFIFFLLPIGVVSMFRSIGSRRW